MAGLHFEVTADNNDFLRKMQGVRSAVANASSGVEKESERMDAAFRRLAASVGAIFTAQQAARIIENIVRVRGEFQQLEVAFTTMLRSGEKADKLMAEAVDFAAHTPFDLQGVADGIRQLLAYGTAAEDAIEEVEMLGNVAAGLSVPLNDMIYLYGTLRSQGRAYTVDIRQFAGRGVPIYEELSKVLGVTVEQVNEFITAGKVGFAEVEQAFKNMTSEGGMFYNLMQEQSKTITGQISNLKDNIDMMFNEMGQNAEGFISDVISGASYLVEHYKDVLRVLGTLVAMYGSYRATLMLVAAAQKATVAAGNVRAWLSLAKGIRTAKDAVTALNLAVKANPLGLIVSAVTGLIAAISSWVSKQREAREEIEAAVKPLQDEYRQVNELANKLKDSNLKEEERKKVLTELKELAPDVVAGIEDEADSLELLNDRLEDFNNAKLAEIAVKRFSMEGGFEETVTELDEAKGKLQQEEADLVNIYADIYARYSEHRSELGKFWRDQLDDIFNSTDSIAEKVNRLYKTNLYDALPQSLPGGTNRELRRRTKDRSLVFGDNGNINDYYRTLNEYREAEDEYAEHAESLSKRIRAVAESMFPDDIGERESLISKLLAAYGLGGDPGNTEPIGPQPRILPKDFDRQVEEAKAAVEEARRELSSLMQGILPENATADFDFASAIEEAAKKLKEAEGKYSTLTGYDPKAAEKAADDRAKAEEKAAAELAEVRARIEDEEYELKKASTTDRIQLLELEKQHALEALQEELEAAKLVYEALGKDTAELEAAYARLSELAGKRYDIEISNERDEQTENAAAELQSLLSQYQDYAAKRKAIEEQYNEDIRKLQKARTDENAAEIDAAIAEASRQMNDELFNIDRSNGEVFSKIFGSIPDMTRQQIREAITLARQELAKLDEDASPEAFKAISDALHELEDADLNWDTSKLEESADNIVTKIMRIQALKEQLSIAEAAGDTERVNELNGEISSLTQNLVASGVTTFANGLQKAAEYMKQIAEYSGDTRLGEMGEQIGALAQNLSAAGQGAAQGGWIGAIVGGVTDMVSQTIEAFVSARLEQEEFLANQRDFAREYAAIQRELKEEDYESIFGTREISKVSDAWKKAQETMKEYNDAVNKEMERPKEEYDFNSLGAGIFLPGTGIGGWGWGKSLTNEYKSALEAFEKGYTELQGMQVKVRDYSGWANFWGKKDEFMSLKDLAPELWDENGVFQVDAAEAFLDQVDQYLASIFGNVSQEISDAIFDAVLNGADAWDSFEDTALSVIDKIGRQMVQEFVVQAYLDTFQDRLRDAVGTDNPSEDLSDIMMEIYSGLGGVLEEGTEAYQEWLEYMEEQGLDITKLYEERAGSTKGVAQASQESIDYLNGLMTNVNDNVFSLSENVKSLASYNKRMLMITTQIEANTRPIANIHGIVGEIYSEVVAIRRTSETQETRGIKIR